MSTGNVENWVGTISEIGPIYPFVGWEFFMFVLGMAAWVGWHVWQTRFENNTYREDLKRLTKKEP
jgi:hypothetical protein